MFKNYILVAFRNFKRNKFYSFLNIFGLAIGIATAILSFMYVAYEVSFDSFHEKSDRVYRIAVDALVGNTEIAQTYTPAVMPAALYNEFPEIDAICRISGSARAVQVKYGDKIFKENDILSVDTTFFNIFSAEFIHGKPEPSILAPNKVVLSEKTAKKYFGDSNPIGKNFEIDEDGIFTVSAVVKDFPENSHFHFTMLASLLSYEGFYNNPRWFANNFRTYLTLHVNNDFKALEAKFSAFVNKYMFEGRYEKSAAKGNKWELYLQPLTDIHLNSHLSGEFEPNGNAAYVYIFGVVAVLVLLIACINFVNLSTAKAATRAKEIGIRKVVGSGRKELISQFIGEALLISLVSLIFALIFVELALVYMPELLGVELRVPYFSTFHVLPALIGLALVVGVLSGIYPALVLSSFQPIIVLKNQLLKGGRNLWSRKVLVIFQYSISICLIVGTFVISKQLHFIQNEQLGFDKEQVIVIKNANIIQDEVNTFKNEIMRIPGVQSASASHRLPGISFNNIGFGAEGFDGGYTLDICMSDPNFQDVLKFNMIKGRFFAEDFATDTSAVVLNEAAVELIGWDDPIGKKINNWSDNNKQFFRVIGVVENLHYESMHNKIQPMGFFCLSPGGYTPRYVSVRVNTDNIASVLNQMQNVWSSFNSQLPFEYSFFDEDYDNLYANEIRTGRLFLVFSGLAIFIACLGLLGLAAFMTEQRTREIGIRKVLGASASTLYFVLSVQFIKWVVLANIIAFPLAWIVMSQWLENFAYRIDMGWWMFALAGGIALAIALMTVSWQAVRAALVNPVESLRYE